MATTIEISDSALKEAASLGMDEFIGVFTNKYLEVIGGDLKASTLCACISFFSGRGDGRWICTAYPKWIWRIYF